jgi:hypothetical protein
LFETSFLILKINQKLHTRRILVGGLILPTNFLTL